MAIKVQKSILECELAALSEPQQCKKVIVCIGDFGMDQYVSWGLIIEELKLDTIWTNLKSSASLSLMKCKPGVTC